MPMSSSQYLLDTNICIYLLKKRFDVESRIRHVGIQNCFISEITLAELYYGASNSGHKEKKMEGVHYIERLFTVLPIRKAIETYADTKAYLNSKGLLIDDFDLLIGATAICHKLIMVTENVKHLSRMPQIRIENWINR